MTWKETLIRYQIRSPVILILTVTGFFDSLKELEKLFIAPKVRQELHETAFVAFAAKGQRE